MKMESVFEVVRNQVLALRIAGIDTRAIHMDSLLVDDLGLDSFTFANLTVQLECALAIPEFPMQQLLDTCRERHEALTVEVLVRCCHALVMRRTPGLSAGLSSEPK